jgi:hypothetical protein
LQRNSAHNQDEEIVVRGTCLIGEYAKGIVPTSFKVV